jgi:hypothetical protein
LERIGGIPVTAQTTWYAPIVNALGNAVREKQRPTLAAKRSSADPYTQASRQGLPAGMECHTGAKSWKVSFKIARLATAIANKP